MFVSFNSNTTDVTCTTGTASPSVVVSFSSNTTDVTCTAGTASPSVVVSFNSNTTDVTCTAGTASPSVALVFNWVRVVQFDFEFHNQILKCIQIIRLKSCLN